jgi:hypothetical protein
MSVTVAMAPNSCIKLTIPSDFDDNGEWSLHDEEAGTLSEDSTSNTPGRVRIYCHGDKVSIQKVVYSTSSGAYCVCNIVTIVPHDHSDLYRGGPAYGTYKSA